MRFPPNLKYLFIFLFAIGVITCATIFLPMVIPNIGDIVMWTVIAAVFVLVLITMVKPFVTFLYARADGLFEVYMDLAEKGIHIFSYHLNSGSDYGPSTREIQHYFIVIETGKVYLKTLFGHTMEPAAGRSGWGDFYSFEESVLQNREFPTWMHKMSVKTKMDLKLGRHQKQVEDDAYEIFQDEYLITIKKYTNVADEGFRVTCSNRQTGKELWKRKI